MRIDLEDIVFGLLKVLCVATIPLLIWAVYVDLGTSYIVTEYYPSGESHQFTANFYNASGGFSSFTIKNPDGSEFKYVTSLPVKIKRIRKDRATNVL